MGDLYFYDADNTDGGVSQLGLSLNSPDGLCSDGKQSVYICETGNSQIKQYNTTTGHLTLLAGSTTPGLISAQADGLGADAGFFDPAGCVYDPVTKALYVSDRSGNTIRKIQ
jgi:DNA-binding beta-propeller fold protein YncE